MRQNKLYELSEEDKLKLPEYAARGITASMSTEGMTKEDQEICMKNVNALYAAANLPLPKNIVFVADPFILRFAGGFAAAIWQIRKNKENMTSVKIPTEAATMDATMAATMAATMDATEAATRAATEAATMAATEAATEAATMAATRAATMDATEAATEAATMAATWAATRDATRDATWYKFNTPNMRALSFSLGINELGLKCAYYSSNLWQGGNQWFSSVCFMQFFKEVTKLPIDWDIYLPWENLALHGGPRLVHPDFCMISDRPELLLVDDQNRPHCETGPFCKWRSGTALYAVHGVRVPWDIIENPKSITVSRIEEEENSEVARIMIDLYEKFNKRHYIQDSKAELISSEILNEREYKLWRKHIKSDDEPLVMVECINCTAELDGSFKKYFIPVHPELRPLLDTTNDTYGEPQELTAINAIASTFGLRGEQYKPNFES